MNEEEKEAIHKLKSVINIDTGVISDDIQDDEIEIILNLIDKQQDEIEQQRRKIYDLYQTTRDYEKMTDITIIPGTGFRVDRREYVSIDKLTRLIQEIESYAYTSLEEKEKQDYAIYELKRLLEE